MFKIVWFGLALMLILNYFIWSFVSAAEEDDDFFSDFETVEDAEQNTGSQNNSETNENNEADNQDEWFGDLQFDEEESTNNEDEDEESQTSGNDLEVDYETKEGAITFYNFDQDYDIKFDVLGEVNVDGVVVKYEWEEIDHNLLDFSTLDRSVHWEVLYPNDMESDEWTVQSDVLLVSPNVRTNELTIEFKDNLVPVEVVEKDLSASQIVTVAEIDYNYEEEDEETQEINEEGIEDNTGMGANLTMLLLLIMFVVSGGYIKVKN